MFFCECWEMFKYSFLYRTHLVHYTFQKFYVKKELPRYKIDIFQISCAIALFFIILVLEWEVHYYFVYILFLYHNFH